LLSDLRQEKRFTALIINHYIIAEEGLSLLQAALKFNISTKVNIATVE